MLTLKHKRQSPHVHLSKNNVLTELPAVSEFHLPWLQFPQTVPSLLDARPPFNNVAGASAYILLLILFTAGKRDWN